MAWCCAPTEFSAVAAEIVAVDATSMLEPVTPDARAAQNPTLLTRHCAASPAAKLGHRDEDDAKPEADSPEERCPPSAQTSWQLSSGEELPSAEAVNSGQTEDSGQQTGRTRKSNRSQTPEEVKAARAEQREQARQMLQPFLEQNGFATVKSSRRRLMNSCYPLHVAVTANNVELIQRLLRAGADPFKCDSSGRTPLELAQKLNTRRSHRRAVEVLKRSTRNGKHWVPWLRTAAGDLAHDGARAGAARSSSSTLTTGSSASSSGDL